MIHVEGRKVCAVCARVLDETASGEYLHYVDEMLGTLDHVAIPVDDTEVRVDERCDFCFNTETTYVLPVRSFQFEGSQHGSLGDWAACSVCGPLIEHNQWNKLEHHVLAQYEARGESMPPEVAAKMRRMWRQLRSNIRGSIRPIDPAAPETRNES